MVGTLAAQSGTKPRASAQDYPAHAATERLAVGAEYTVHSFSGGDESYLAKDYLVVEVALFPAKGQTLAVSAGQFRLRVNKKQPLEPQAAEFVAADLKYPDWVDRNQMVTRVGPVVFGQPAPTERFPQDPRGLPRPSPPQAPEDNPSGIEKQPPVKPEELVVRTALPEGEQHQPVSGYLYFPSKGSVKHIRSLVLEFSGGEGGLSLPLIGR